jgi:hypothetical protein
MPDAKLCDLTDFFLACCVHLQELYFQGDECNNLRNTSCIHTHAKGSHAPPEFGVLTQVLKYLQYVDST